ncbi:MAG: cobaltochelatase subunit CobN, partial [Rhodobacteraceae bacterium]|nr:cobaltochelatase subunit CobN [Paracoccaceae bacterium]
ELKESQIRDGLHVFGSAPKGTQERDLAASLLRTSRGDGRQQNESLLRALAADLRLNEEFDPLDCQMSEAWSGRRPAPLCSLSADAWRSNGDTVERLELLASRLLDGKAEPPGPASRRVVDYANLVLRRRIADCGQAELNGLLTALDGSFVPPGPSGAPSRGRLDVLPTGRNFYSIDSRSLPTQTAWELGWKSATRLVDTFAQSKGHWPKHMALTAWGTSNMRTGGDDIAQALALMGVRPTWDDASGRGTGIEVIPPDVLGRPRVDVTLRVSGFFRDAFPMQLDLVASAAHTVMNLDEPSEQNPAAAACRRDIPLLGRERASYRVFGSKPGAYGAGLQAQMDERNWTERRELGETYLDWGAFAYGCGAEGRRDRNAFKARLKVVEAVVQNQDNREHDVLDSDDYYQFEGGMSAAVESLSGNQPTIYHNDHSRPERPVIRTLEQEIGRVVRSRAANPKWIAGVKRHGYKGAFEIAATVDYLFAFAATTGTAKSHHFDLLYLAYIEDADTREFIRNANPAALREIAARFEESIERGLWQPKSNSCR